MRTPTIGLSRRWLRKHQHISLRIDDFELDLPVLLASQASCDLGVRPGGDLLEKGRDVVCFNVNVPRTPICSGRIFRLNVTILLLKKNLDSIAA